MALRAPRRTRLELRPDLPVLRRAAFPRLTVAFGALRFERTEPRFFAALRFEASCVLLLLPAIGFLKYLIQLGFSFCQHVNSTRPVSQRGGLTRL